MKRFKVGDRVQIVRISYVQSEAQGLFVGNTGTIRTVYHYCYGVETDGANSKMDALTEDGEGWAFDHHDLKLVDARPSLLSRLMFWRESA